MDVSRALFLFYVSFAPASHSRVNCERGKFSLSLSVSVSHDCRTRSHFTSPCFSVTSFHEGVGGREESRRILVQRREQGREDRGGGQRKDQEDRRREREFFFHCHTFNLVSADRFALMAHVAAAAAAASTI